MGSIVEYRCGGCTFSTGRLSVGWGKAGRASFWGGLAVCEACKDLTVIDLADTRTERRDRRCAQCNGPLKLFDGIVQRIGCPRCGVPLRCATLGSWS
jgi:hypothetical protein